MANSWTGFCILGTPSHLSSDNSKEREATVGSITPFYVTICRDTEPFVFPLPPQFRKVMRRIRIYLGINDIEIGYFLSNVFKILILASPFRSSAYLFIYSYVL